MIPLHSTHLKKVYSDNLETNSIQPVNLIASEVLQPTIEIKPTNNIIRHAESGETVFTTPTDKDFFLTNIIISTAEIGV